MTARVQAAGLAGIGGCYALWHGWRQGGSAPWRVPAVRRRLAQVPSAALGGVSVAASPVWMRAVEGARPDRRDMTLGADPGGRGDEGQGRGAGAIPRPAPGCDCPPPTRGTKEGAMRGIVMDGTGVSGSRLARRLVRGGHMAKNAGRSAVAGATCERAQR